VEVDLLCRKCTTGCICQYEDVKNREEVSVPFGSSTPMSDAVGTGTGRSERARGDATVNLQACNADGKLDAAAFWPSTTIEVYTVHFAVQHFHICVKERGPHFHIHR
jgi:hypothetical protein